ncbi:MAG TPA: hypothetical protein VGR27_07250, partial [Longimicrobiaceae bacterium]|nr:hypothetical protein [Longimicrobiaceae bacterium]
MHRTTFCIALTLMAASAQAQEQSLTTEAIFGRREFRGADLPEIRWMRDGRSYVELRSNPDGGTDIVRVDLPTGEVTVLAEAAALLDEQGNRIEVEEITLSPDETRALLLHGSVRVWRDNTRGIYHVLDFRTKRLTPITRITTPTGRPSTQTDTLREPFLGQNASFLAGELGSGIAEPERQM